MPETVDDVFRGFLQGREPSPPQIETSPRRTPPQSSTVEMEESAPTLQGVFDDFLKRAAPPEKTWGERARTVVDALMGRGPREAYPTERPAPSPRSPTSPEDITPTGAPRWTPPEQALTARGLPGRPRPPETEVPTPRAFITAEGVPSPLAVQPFLPTPRPKLLVPPGLPEPTPESEAAAEAALRRHGSVVAPARTLVQQVTETLPGTAIAAGWAEGPEVTLGRIFDKSGVTAGTVEQLREDLGANPTVLDKTLRLTANLFTPATAATFALFSIKLPLQVVQSALVRVFGERAAMQALTNAAQASVAGAASLGGYNAVQNALQQTARAREGGPPASVGELAKATASGVATGATLGAARLLPGTILQRAGEIGALATVPSAIEGRMPTWEDVVDAGLVIGVMGLTHALPARVTQALSKPRADRTPGEQAVADQVTRGLQGAPIPAPSGGSPVSSEVVAMVANGFQRMVASEFIVQSDAGEFGKVTVQPNGVPLWQRITNPRTIRDAQMDRPSRARVSVSADEFDGIFPTNPKGYAPGVIEQNRTQFVQDEGIPIGRRRAASRAIPAQPPPATEAPRPTPVPEVPRGAGPGIGEPTAGPPGPAAPVPATAAPTVPEAPTTIAAQMEAMAQGKKPAVLVPPGQTAPVPEGFASVQTSAGTLIYDPAQITLTADEITAKVEAGQAGDILGYGVEAKPAPGKPAAMVETRGPADEEIQTVVSPAPVPPAVTASAVRMQPPGGSVTVTPPAEAEARAHEILAERAEAPAAPPVAPREPAVTPQPVSLETPTPGPAAPQRAGILYTPEVEALLQKGKVATIVLPRGGQPVRGVVESVSADRATVDFRLDDGTLLPGIVPDRLLSPERTAEVQALAREDHQKGASYRLPSYAESRVYEAEQRRLDAEDAVPVQPQPVPAEAQTGQPAPPSATIPPMPERRGPGQEPTQQPPSPQGGIDISTSEFMEWFGNSKVVSPEGNPVPVYHGSNVTFETFDLTKATSRRHNIGGERISNESIWFVENKRVAQRFANQARAPEGVLYPGASIKTAYLKMENPLVVDMAKYPLSSEAKKWSVPALDTKKTIHEIGFDKERILRQAKKDSHDGVIFKNGYDQDPRSGDIYAVFSPDQIKLVGRPSPPAAPSVGAAPPSPPATPPFTEGQRVVYTPPGGKTAFPATIATGGVHADGTFTVKLGEAAGGGLERHVAPETVRPLVQRTGTAGPPGGVERRGAPSAPGPPPIRTLPGRPTGADLRAKAEAQVEQKIRQQMEDVEPGKGFYLSPVISTTVGGKEFLVKSGDIARRMGLESPELNRWTVPSPGSPPAAGPSREVGQAEPVPAPGRTPARGGAAGSSTAAVSAAQAPPTQIRAPEPAPAVIGEPRPAAPPAKPNPSALRKVAEGLRVTTRDILRVVAPQAQSAEAGETARVLREMGGTLAQRTDRAVAALSDAHRYFRTQDPRANYDFIGRIERGEQQPSADLQAIADPLRTMLDDRRQQVQVFGKLRQFYEHYFPHVWQEPGRAEQIIQDFYAKRPMEGSRGFLKHRSHPTLEDGLQAGLVPVSDNPVDHVLLKIREMDKFITAHRAVAELKEKGLWKFQPVGSPMPEGWARVEDRIATVFGKPTVTVKEAFDQQMRDRLEALASTLGITHERKVRIGGRRWGYARGQHVVTKFGGPDSVLVHEIGHALDTKFGLSELLKGKDVPPGVGTELRDLADLRYEGADVPQGYRDYVRKRPEKIANAITALVWTPDTMEAVAPKTYEYLRHALYFKFPELRPLFDMRHSLVLGEATAEVPVGGMVIHGSWIMSKEAADVVNNHLSPGLRERSAAFRAFLGIGNALNQFQLGWSGFHLGFTTLDAVTSKFALGLYQAMHGQPLRGLATIAQTPTSPVANFLLGDKMLKEWTRPGSQGEEIARFVDGMREAGGRARWDQFYQTHVTGKMLEAFRRGTLGGLVEGVFRLPFAATEQVARVIFEQVVPRQKLGVFADMARYELERMGPNADPEGVREAMAKAWDSADNRMGQLVYDNLFWNKTFKDLAMASVRSVGWNLGTWRELGGGLKDVATMDRSFRAAYLVALPVVTGTIGAMMTYLMTGKGPETLLDYFYPKTGNLDENGRSERVTLPSYMKDIFHAAREPGTTILNKVHPIISLAGQMLQNKDYYGTQVVNEDDPIVQRALDRAKFVVESMQPFSIRALRRERNLSGSTLSQVGPFVGVTPAPMAMNRTPAEGLAREYLMAKRPQGARTQEATEHARAVDELARDVRLGKDITEKRGQMIGEGKITARDLPGIRKRAKGDWLQTAVKSLSVGEAAHVYEDASDEERGRLRRIIQMKVNSAAGRPFLLPPRVRERLERLGFTVPRRGQIVPSSGASEDQESGQEALLTR